VATRTAAYYSDHRPIVVDMQVAQLLFVASVDESRKLVCQAPGCGRAIAKAVHAIRDSEGAVRVVGSGCYVKLSGNEQATKYGPAIAGFDGRRLTPEERAAMIADTAAFVASVEARLAEERQRTDARSLGERRSEAVALRRASHDDWKQQVGNGPESMPLSQRAHARGKLAQFRAQQARQAARIAVQRRPELSVHALDVVADAMTQAKAAYIASGRRMDASDARRVIEDMAIAALAERAHGGSAR